MTDPMGVYEPTDPTDLTEALTQAQNAYRYADKMENLWLAGDAIDTDHGAMVGDRLRHYAAMVRADGDSRALLTACELLVMVVERLDQLADTTEPRFEIIDEDSKINTPAPVPCNVTAVQHAGHIHWDDKGDEHFCTGAWHL